MLKKTKGKMKRRNTESSMQLALQAAPSGDPDEDIFWVNKHYVKVIEHVAVDAGHVATLENLID